MVNIPISGGHTFSNVVPPGRVERVVGPPRGDTRAVCLARVVLILVCRSKLTLAIKMRERVDVTLPPKALRNGGVVSARDMLRTPNLMRQTHVCASTISNVCGRKWRAVSVNNRGVSRRTTARRADAPQSRPRTHGSRS